MNFKAIAMAAVLLASACLLALPAWDSDADGGITVTDGLGNEVTLESPAQKIMTIGTGATATAIGIGAIDKISVCDSYSKTNKAPLFDVLREYVEDGRIAAGGNLYSSGISQLKNDVINAVDKGFDLEKDVVIVTGSDTYRANLIPLLEDKGFKNVLQWRDVTEFEDIVDFAKCVSTVCFGEVCEQVLSMESETDGISKKVSAVDEKAEAFYVTYSANAFKVGNTGSLANSMIIAAGGESVTVDPSRTASTYETNITMLVENHPGCIAFLDASIWDNADRLAEFNRATGNSIETVPLDPIWNNYCLESVKGVQTMAEALYPDLFAEEPSFTVTDGLGNSIVLESPAEHVMTIGTGATATAIGIGAIDKISVCDSYSKTNKAPLFDVLREYVEDGRIAAGGNLYSSGISQLKNDVINAVDKGFDLEKDVVIVTGSDTYRANLIPLLEDKGFKNVLQWRDVTEFGDIVDFAKSISVVCYGEVCEQVLSMESEVNEITEKVSSATEKAEAFYVTYSANAFKVGNTGSLANSMIIAAGGESVAVDPSRTASTYETSITMLVENHPGCIAFLDASIWDNADRLAEFNRATGNSIETVPLESIWNNYCLESVNGVHAMAEAMYPEMFEASPQDNPESSGSEDGIDAAMIAGIAIAILVVIGIAVFAVRKKS